MCVTHFSNSFNWSQFHASFFFYLILSFSKTKVYFSLGLIKASENFQLFKRFQKRKYCDFYLLDNPYFSGLNKKQEIKISLFGEKGFSEI